MDSKLLGPTVLDIEAGRPKVIDSRQCDNYTTNPRHVNFAGRSPSVHQAMSVKRSLLHTVGSFSHQNHYCAPMIPPVRCV